jgi:hypothetical protein
VLLILKLGCTCKWDPTPAFVAQLGILINSTTITIQEDTELHPPLVQFKMATRRIVATEKTFLDKDDPIDENSSTAPAVPR